MCVRVCVSMYACECLYTDEYKKFVLKSLLMKKKCSNADQQTITKTEKCNTSIVLQDDWRY